MVLITRGKNRGKKKRLLRVENAEFYLEEIDEVVSPFSVEVGEEDLELIGKDTKLINEFDIQSKFSGRYIFERKGTKYKGNTNWFRNRLI